MRSALLTVVEVLLVWTLLSILAGMAISRIARGLQRREAPLRRTSQPGAADAQTGQGLGFRPASDLPAHVNVACTDGNPTRDTAPCDPIADLKDAVEATGEVWEESLPEPVPVSEWPDDALARLWAAIEDAEGFDTEMLCYELRSELDLLGVAGFTQRWRWRGEPREEER